MTMTNDDENNINDKDDNDDIDDVRSRFHGHSPCLSGS